MRLSITSLSLSLLLVLSPSSAYIFDCKSVLKEDVKWNLGKLAGPHQVSWIRHHGYGVVNTTFKVDICKALVVEEDEKKGCGLGTRICAVEHETDQSKNDHLVGAWPIVREFAHDGAHIEPKVRRLKTSKADGEEQAAIEGVEIEMGGGKSDGRSQKAMMTFICPKEETKRRRSDLNTMDDEEDGDDDGNHGDKGEWKAARSTKDGQGGTIEFISYKDDVLDLEWTTPYACEGAASKPEDDEKQPDSGDGEVKRGGWGFFSWFFFLVFMLFAGFVVFTAWINYTRNGARGYDLLPFSDTLRDLPYILGDWSRKIASTLGGSGTRGGYSAV